MKEIIKNKIQKAKSFLTRNIGHISLLAFVLGFFLDVFTLPNVTNFWSYMTGVIYAILVGVLILVREYIKSDKVTLNIFGKKEEEYVAYFSVAIAFFMGSFISFVFIYYMRAADIISGLPILAFIFLIMCMNEWVDSRSRLLFDILIYSICITLFFIFLTPVFLGRVGDYVFNFSILLSGIFLYFYTKLIYSFDLDQDREFSFLDKFKSIKISKIYKKLFEKYNFKIYNYILLVPGIIFSLYFTNIIPAVPLTMREANFYQSVFKKTNTFYTFNQKCIKSWNPFVNCYFVYDDLYDDNISFYNEVQAPAKLNAKLSHKWEYYNKSRGVWELKNIASYYVYGGRENGYRGYTSITNIQKGLYKVTVMIDDKRVLGSKKFEVR